MFSVNPQIGGKGTEGEREREQIVRDVSCNKAIQQTAYTKEGS